MTDNLVQQAFSLLQEVGRLDLLTPAARPVRSAVVGVAVAVLACSLPHGLGSSEEPVVSGTRGSRGSFGQLRTLKEKRRLNPERQDGPTRDWRWQQYSNAVTLEECCGIAGSVSGLASKVVAIWLVGHSFIKWACLQAHQGSDGANLGFKSAAFMLQWHGKGGEVAGIGSMFE
ncbi:hypothetical protein NDU88_003517 [Pleurodeles waltl]|uniref:Uncharacterized protein n=1 Tax=Pleurodeles waltl TaxID=8319 RepID=A0AAV7QD20_PLEWA|nr:hypothetical protein NDU88_003517 [Pleurodeles waltl]